MNKQLCNSVSTAEFLAYLRRLDVELRDDEGRLACSAPKGILSFELQGEIKLRKSEILDLIRENRIPENGSHSARIEDLFDEKASNTPNAVAVVSGAERISYRELNTRANRLARRLRAMGVGPDVLAGIYVERSIDMVTALLGVLKAGGAYLPLDMQYPKERIGFMLADSGAAVLITQEYLIDSLPAGSHATLCFDRDREEIEAEGAEAPESPGDAGDLAYVIYTSGSTGRPKGVEIEHRSVVNFLLSMKRRPGITADDRLLAITTLCFDIAGLEIFLPLISGAQVWIAPRAVQSDGKALAALLEESQTTVLQATPVTWRLLLDSGWKGIPGLKMLCGGEALSRELANRLLTTGGELWNLYGPTETTIWSTIQRVGAGVGAVPIGSAIANTQLYVLDDDRRAVAPGTEGELYIGGHGLSRGYRRRAEITAERFVANPFHSGMRMYRTGDLVRRLPEGELEYIGRLDSQIKLRGYRIELGEIEAVLEQQAGVHHAVVVVREDQPGDQRLVAYLIAGTDDNAGALRETLSARLPEYMVPSAFVFLDAFPLTLNQKVDRNALPAPVAESKADPKSSDNGVTARLSAMWQSILNLREFGLHDNFFALGGHSLLIVRLQSRIHQEFGCDVSVAELFQRPTIAEMAELLGSGIERPAAGAAKVQGPAPIPTVAREGNIPLSSAQLRLWFLDQLAPGSTAYILPMAVRLRGPLDLGALGKTLTEIVRRHESLRTVFPAINGTPQQVIMPVAPMELEVVDLSGIPASERERRGHELVAEDARRPFDLSSAAPLFRARIARLDATDHILSITVHHAVFDAWSVEVFWREVGVLYSNFVDGRDSGLPPLPVQFVDFTVWQKASLEGGPRESHMDYWRRQLGGGLPVLDLPADRPRRPLELIRSARTAVDLPTLLCEKLRALSQASGVSLYILLLGAFHVLLHRLSGQDDILVGTPIAGRNRVEIEDMIGFFVNTVVVRTRADPSVPFQSFLDQVRDAVLSAHAHQDLPFEELVEALDPERDLTRTPLFQVFFNHLNGGMSPIRIPGVTAEPLFEFELESKFDLTVYVTEQSGAARFDLVYKADLFDAARAVSMLDQYVGLLEQIAQDPARSIGEYSLLTESARQVIPDQTQLLESRWEGSIQQRFAAIAAESPQRTAVEEEGLRWSYGELDALSARLARWLVANGISEGGVVAVFSDRSASLVLAVLATLRAGGAFSILDATLPSARLAACVRAIRPKVWLQTAEVEPDGELDVAIAEAGCHRLTLARTPSLSTIPESDAALAGEPTPDNPAYIAFTSGTTGQPRFIPGTHRPLSHFLAWHAGQFGLTGADRFSMLSGLGHDPLLRDIFTPLWLGATLSIPSREDIFSPGRLRVWMARQRVTISHLTPALGTLLTEVDPTTETARYLPELRYAFFGGDVLMPRDVAALRTLAPSAQVVNFYGATETPQAMAWFRADVPLLSVADAAEDMALKPVPLGQGIDGVQILIVNGFGAVAGVGEPGEIRVRTPYLSQGYLNDPALTRERFVVDAATGNVSDRIYRTGDFGRYRPDGAVEFAGRADGQVKIRGHRIEPAEIEAAITTHSGVGAGAVIVHDDRGRDRRLVAYFATRNGKRPTPEALRAHVARLLPEYMVPAAFIELASMPLTPNGKIDRRALVSSEAPVAPDCDRYSSPTTHVERVITEVWSEVLSVDRVGVTDNFFELGGHSLAATRLVARLRSAFRVELPLRSLFLEPTIEGLARHIRYDVAAQSYRYVAEIPHWTCLVPAQPRGSRTPLFFVGGHQNPDDPLLVLSRFIRHLGFDQPVFGFRPRWIEGTAQGYTSVEEMALEFLAELRTVQPRGPYLLGGFCIGGVVAMETARLLLKEGEEVRLLMLLDTERPTALRAFLANLRLFLRRCRHISGALRDLVLPHDRSRGRVVIDLIRRKLASRQPVAQDPVVATTTEALHEQRTAYRRLIYASSPMTYPGRLTLAINAAQHRFDPDMGWKEMALGGLDIHCLPGDHDTVLTMHGKEFAELLRRCIDEVLPQNEVAPSRAESRAS